MPYSGGGCRPYLWPPPTLGAPRNARHAAPHSPYPGQVRTLTPDVIPCQHPKTHLTPPSSPSLLAPRVLSPQIGHPPPFSVAWGSCLLPWLFPYLLPTETTPGFAGGGAAQLGPQHPAPPAPKLPHSTPETARNGPKCPCNCPKSPHNGLNHPVTTSNHPITALRCPIMAQITE